MLLKPIEQTEKVFCARKTNRFSKSSSSVNRIPDPFREVTRHMAGSRWKPLPQHQQDATTAEANWILFVRGSKRHGSKLSKTASLSVCREKALQCTTLGNRDLSTFHLLSLPAELLPFPEKHTSILLVTKYTEFIKSRYSKIPLQMLEPTKTPDNGNSQHSPPNQTVVGGKQQTTSSQLEQF